MNQVKLDALYARATDERTPEEERRTSAVLYLKHAPKMREPTTEELRKSVTKEMFSTLYAPEIAEHQRQMAEQKSRSERDAKRAEKAESELHDLKEAIRAARTASEKVAKLVDGESKIGPQKYGTPYANQYMADLFNGEFVIPKR